MFQNSSQHSAALLGIDIFVMSQIIDLENSLSLFHGLLTGFSPSSTCPLTSSVVDFFKNFDGVSSTFVEGVLAVEVVEREQPISLLSKSILVDAKKNDK